MAKKIAKSGLTFSDLKLACTFERKGLDGLVLFREKNAEGKVRVTKSSPVVKSPLIISTVLLQTYHSDLQLTAKQLSLSRKRRREAMT